MKIPYILLLIAYTITNAQSCNHHEIAITYHEMGAFANDLESIVEDLIAHFDKPASHNKQVVVFDIDDTALSNYHILKSMNFTFEFPAWEHHLRTTHLPAIEQIHKLYHHFKDRNYSIIFLTSRPERLREVTIRNLSHVGYHGYDRLIMYAEKHTVTHSSSFKEQERIKLTQEGYEIVCTLDDQDVYLIGECLGRAVKIPNKFYSLKP